MPPRRLRSRFRDDRPTAPPTLLGGAVVASLAERHAPDDDLSVMDVGSGRADVLAAAASRGWWAVGVEPSVRLRWRSTARGFRTTRSIARAVDLAPPLDAVTVLDPPDRLGGWDVALPALRRGLRKGGTLVVARGAAADEGTRLQAVLAAHGFDVDRVVHAPVPDRLGRERLLVFAHVP